MVRPSVLRPWCAPRTIEPGTTKDHGRTKDQEPSTKDAGPGSDPRAGRTENRAPRTKDCRMATLPELLKTLVEKKGSDLHIATDTPPQIRVNGELARLE